MKASKNARSEARSLKHKNQKKKKTLKKLQDTLNLWETCPYLCHMWCPSCQSAPDVSPRISAAGASSAAQGRPSRPKGTAHSRASSVYPHWTGPMRNSSKLPWGHIKKMDWINLLNECTAAW